MNAWYRDQSGCLIKIEFEVGLDNLFESSIHSHTLGTMADDGSDHGENENMNLNGPSMWTLREYLQPPRNSTLSCIIFSHQGNNFNFKPGTIPLLPKFHGVEYENPYLYIKEFEEVCYTFHDQTCSE
jgi:hypothetical protein